jgi:hypothetical protein
MRDRQAERLGGLEVDHEIELGRLLDGEICRVGPLQNLRDEARRAPLHLGEIRTVGHEPSRFRDLPQREHPRQPGFQHRGRDFIPVAVHQWEGETKQRLGTPLAAFPSALS